MSGIASPTPGLVAVIQARMGSARLPGKALALLAGKPLLWHVVERVRSGSLVSKVVIATTDRPGDAPILDLAAGMGVPTFAGSENDVLDRIYRAAVEADAKVVVRVTADDPFKDPAVLDKVAQVALEDSALDYVSNTIQPSSPLGLDIEVIRIGALKRAWSDAVTPYDREHVTPFVYGHPGLFALRNVAHDVDLSQLRWTIDYPADLAFARAVYDRLHDTVMFRMDDVLNLLSNDRSVARLANEAAAEAKSRMAAQR